MVVLFGQEEVAIVPAGLIHRDQCLDASALEKVACDDGGHFDWVGVPTCRTTLASKLPPLVEDDLPADSSKNRDLIRISPCRAWFRNPGRWPFGVLRVPSRKEKVTMFPITLLSCIANGMSCVFH